MRQPQIWQVESGTPRRKLSVGEANAFAHVFGVSLAQLLTPPTEDFPTKLVQLSAEFRDWLLAEGAQADHLVSIDVQIAELDEDESYTAETVAKFSALDSGQTIAYLDALIAKYQRVLNDIREGKSGWDVVAAAASVAPPSDESAH